MPTERLTLRPVVPEDEEPFRRAHRDLAAAGYTFAHGYDEAEAFPRYVARLARQAQGVEVRDGWVPTTFLVADVGGVIVGRASIRHQLNESLLREGGHIGYAVLPEHRRRGYATEILRQSLEVAREHGVDRALLTCDDDNVGSATVIERCGGVLDSIGVGERGQPLRHYWIG